MPSDLVVAVAGSVSAGFSTLSVYPLDTIKTHLNKGTTKDGSRALRTVSDVMREIVQKQGFLSLYSGIRLKIMMSMLQKFFYFFIYNYLSRKISRGEKSLSMASNLVVGYLSALASVAILTPVEVAQTRQQLNKDKSLREIVLEVLRSGQAYNGFQTNLILCINPSIEFTVFDQIKKRNGGKLSTSATFWLGAFAKAVATVTTFPHVRAKVLQQSGHPKFQNMDATGIIVRLIATDGPTSVFAGMKAQLVKNVIGAAIMQSVKDRIENRVVKSLSRN